MTRDDVQDWLDRYVEAWRTYDPAQIGDLFAADVEYRYHAWDEGDDVPRGRDEVVRSWVAPDGQESSRDQPGTWDAEYRAFAVDGDRAVATGWSRYWSDASRATVDRTYENVFLLEFDADGRCRRFTEVFEKRPKERA